MKRSKVLQTLALALTFLLHAAPVAAQSSDAALAETLFQEGKRLMAQGNFAAACPKFEDSYKLDPGTGTLMNLAACFEGAGKFASAWSMFHDAMARARREGQDARVKNAQERIRQLDDRLTRVVITVPDKVRVPGLVVKLDETVVTPSAFGVPTPVNPGTHNIEATAPGKKTFRLKLEAGTSKGTLQAPISALEDAPASAAAPATPPTTSSAAPSGALSVAVPASTASDAGTPDTSERARGKRTLGLVIGAGGLVAVGVGAVFAALTKSEDNKAAALCTQGAEQNRCSTEDEKANYETHTQSAKTDALAAYVGFGVGGAALIAGSVLLLSAKASSPSAGHPVVTPLVARDVLGASAAISW